MKDAISVRQKRQLVEQIEDSKSRLMNGKYDGATLS